MMCFLCKTKQRTKFSLRGCNVLVVLDIHVLQLHSPRGCGEVGRVEAPAHVLAVGLARELDVGLGVAVDPRHGAQLVLQQHVPNVALDSMPSARQTYSMSADCQSYQDQLESDSGACTPRRPPSGPCPASPYGTQISRSSNCTPLRGSSRRRGPAQAGRWSRSTCMYAGVYLRVSSRDLLQDYMECTATGILLYSWRSCSVWRSASALVVLLGMQLCLEPITSTCRHHPHLHECRSNSLSARRRLHTLYRSSRTFGFLCTSRPG